MSTDLVLVKEVSLDEHPAAVYLASLSKSGRDTMRGCLDTIAGELIGMPNCALVDWSKVRFQHTSAIRSNLDEVYAPATVNKHLCALRGTLKASWQLGQTSAEDYLMAVSIKGVNGDTVLAGRDLGKEEIAALVEVCKEDNNQVAGVRDCAIIGVLVTCGLRRAEIVALDLADYTPSDNSLLVNGKRNKQRYCHPQNGTGQALDDWIALRGDDPGPLFFPVNKSDKITHGQRLTKQAIYNLLKKRQVQAGLNDFSPHDLRRTCAGDLLDQGVDLSTVAKILGHSSVQTTARYDRRPEETKRKAAAKLYFPY